MAAIFFAAFALQGMTFYALYDSGGVERAAGYSMTGKTGPAQIVITQTFVVVNTADDGREGSLRWAIEQANASPGRDRIEFAFPESITLTLQSPLPPITEGVEIDGLTLRTPLINGFVPIPYPNIDGRNVPGDLIVITVTNNTSIQGLRLLNAFGASAVSIHNATNTVLKDNFIDLSTRGIFVHGSEGITLTNNVLTNIGTQGITFGDGVRFADVITNSISVLRGSGITAAGDPAPDHLFIKGIVITVPVQPIAFGPGVNRDFPAPQIDGAIRVITQTLRNVPPQLVLDVASFASPDVYTYPLTVDLYRVRGDSYVPTGRSILFGAELFPGPVGITYTLAADQFRLDDRFALLASTADRLTSEISDPQEIVLVPVEDTTPPVCELVSINRENGKAVSVTIHVHDEESGVVRIDVERARNARLEIPAGSGNFFTENEAAHFDPPETDLIEILGEKVDADAGAQIAIAAWDDAGNVARCDPVVATLTSEVAERLHIEQNYPNPFNPETVIEFQIPEASHVSLSVFDLIGREITSLIEGTYEPGTYSVRWDGRTQGGVAVPSGVYIYRLKVGREVLERAMVLAR